VVHLPVYEANPYQRLLMEAQRQSGVTTIDGGGGGNFFRTALLRWKADIMHFHWLHPYMIRPSALGTILRSSRLLVELTILKLFGQRIVWTVHNLSNHSRQHLLLERWFTKRFSRMPAAIIAHSRLAAARIEKTFMISDPERIHVVPYGNYIGYYPNCISRREAREKLGIPRESTALLFFGRIEPYQGVSQLIAEFKSLSQELFLIIAGPTSDATIVQANRDAIGAAPNIMLHSEFISDERVQFYMNACDVVVLPYLEILTASAAMLAMSFGRPCIAPRLSGMLELLDEQGAFFYDRDKPGALAEAIRAAANNSENLARMGAYNFAKISSYDWTKAAAATLKVYHDIC